MERPLPPDLGKRVGDLDDLPEALRRELQIGRMKESEQQIVDVIANAYDGVANVDEILVGLFRVSGNVHPRQFIANKLYRMAQAGHLVSVPKKKGVYCVK